MAKTILYGVQKLTPTTDNNFYISYDPNSRPESTNEVRYLVDTTLQVAPAPINIYLPASSSFQGILPIWIFVVDVSGTSQTRPIIIHASGGDKINGISTITLNTNNASLCVQLASQGYWFSPTTGSGVVGLVQSVSGLNTDNTDPLNPVVQIAVDGVSITGAGTPVSPLVANFPAPPPALVFGSTITGSGTALSPYNAQLLLGSGAIDGTLVVSPLGNDATAVPYDMQRHYSTIDSAVAVAKSGDTILVYAGTYTATTNWAKDGITLHFMDGAVVYHDSTLFDNTGNFSFVVSGYGRFIQLSTAVVGGSFLAQPQANTATVWIQARSIQHEKSIHVFFLYGGTTYIDILDDLSGNFRCFQCDFAPNVFVTAKRIRLIGTYPVYSSFGAVICRFRSSNNFNGTFVMNADVIDSLNGNNAFFNFNCQSGGKIIINFNRLIARTTINPTQIFIIANICTGYIEINGDVYANGVGVQSSAIYCVNFFGSYHSLVYNGNMYMEVGYALRTSNGSRITMSGNFYGNPTPQVEPFGAPTPPVGSLFVVGTYNMGFGSPTSSTIIKNSTVNVYNVGSTCIYKSMMPDGGGGLTFNSYLELQNVKLYSDLASNSIVSMPPLAPATNTTQTIGVVENALVDANTTIIGVAPTLNVNLVSYYPPIV